MAMIAGDADCTVGLSGAIWAAWSAPGGPGAQLTGEDAGSYATRSAKMKVMAYGIATAVVATVKTADVTGTATGAMGGGPGVPVVGGVA